MAVHLVIERPRHAPRLLGSFETRVDAEVMREQLIARNPSWKSFLRLIGRSSGVAPGDVPSGV